ncbi:MAG: bacteriorhodopsin [Candidatus Nanohaloarchaea archaeon]|nr:bacteriorhodopsin [Candidatus Nanohaloarchaea archaeon]
MPLQLANPANAAGAAVFFATFLAFLAWSYRNQEGLGEFSVGVSYKQVFGVVLSIVPLVAGLSYTLMAFDLGFVEVAGRTVSYIRYFEWGVSTPLLLFGLAALTQKDRLVYGLVGLDVAMIVTGFFASVTTGAMKLGFLAVSTGAFLVLLYLLLFRSKEAIEKRPETIQKIFRPLRILTLLVWGLYPFVWALSTDGFALVGFEVSQLVFMALDLTAKVGYTGIVLYRLETLGSRL